MDVTKLLVDLRGQRDLLLQAIVALEKLGSGGGKRRGRPPKWAQSADGAPPDAAAPKKRVISPEARKRMAEAQKKRWAAARKAKA
jgi:hypothetical protein